MDTTETRIREVLRAKGAEAAAALCREWIAEAKFAKVAQRRELFGQALGIFKAPTDNPLMRENRRRLNDCGLHLFESVIDARDDAPAMLRCLSCRGCLPFEQAAEYARGYAAAGGNPEAVIEGFTR